MLAFNAEHAEDEPITLDSVSCQILDVLQENARTPLAEIGRRVGLTAPAVAERVKRMEEAGIITGYHAHVDPDQLGFPITAIVRMVLNGPCTPESVRRVAEVHNITEFYFTTGDHDLLLKGAFRSMAHLDRTLAALSQSGTVSTTIVLTHKSMPYRPMTLNPEESQGPR